MKRAKNVEIVKKKGLGLERQQNRRRFRATSAEGKKGKREEKEEKEKEQ